MFVLYWIPFIQMLVAHHHPWELVDQLSGTLMGHKQGKGGMQACPMNPQMIGMGAKGKWMPNTCWASTCPWPWAREACLLHMGCLAPFSSHWFHAYRLASTWLASPCTKLISAATWWEAVILLKQLVDDEVQVNAICLTTQLPSLVGSLCRGRSDGSLRCRWQKWWPSSESLLNKRLWRS